jgi:hydrogenase maturation protease
MQAAADMLDNCLDGDTVIVGIGHRWRGDDAAGPALIDRLSGRVSARCLDAGDAPERHLGAAAGASDTILLVDAVDFGGAPGEVAVFAERDLPDRFGTTHDVPLRLLMGYLRAQSGAAVLLLGIQPADTAFGAPMSGPVRASVELVAEMLTARLSRAGQASTCPSQALRPALPGRPGRRGGR